MSARPFPINAILGLAGALLLSSCNYFSATPVLEGKDTQLSRKDFSGKYSVKTLSWFVRDRDNLRKANVVLHENGTYTVTTPRPATNRELLPSPSGTWEVTPYHGMDLGSRETWAIRFRGTDGSQAFAWSLDFQPPYRLMFVDQSRVGIGEILILRRVGSANH
jgi:hypothetical protein